MCNARIRFLGLFDTVNSVPRFENAWMQRSKFPYTARSTAKVIRHAVAIDERRAKFRQDLISELKPPKDAQYRRRTLWDFLEEETDAKTIDEKAEVDELTRGRASAESHPDALKPAQVRLKVPRFRDASEVSGVRSLSPNMRDGDSNSVMSASQDSLAAIRRDNAIFAEDEDSDDEEQDIKEVWFPGCHAVCLPLATYLWTCAKNHRISVVAGL